MFLLGTAGSILKWIVSPPFYKTVLQFSIDLRWLASGREGAPWDVPPFWLVTRAGVVVVAPDWRVN